MLDLDGQFAFLEEIAFFMFEMGKTRKAILGYEIHFMYSYANKRFESIITPEPESDTAPSEVVSRSGSVIKKVKTMTSAQMLAKVKARNK